MSTDKDLTQVYRSLPHGQRRESVRASVKERFWAKVAKGEGCWNWTASLSSTGYGQFSIRHRPYLAHRLVYQMTRGPIPKGMQIDHLCRNKKCVNPQHLEIVTPAENLRRVPVRRDQTGPRPWLRKSHCRRGHEFTPATERIKKDGRRVCRLCERIVSKQWRARANP